MQLLVAVSSLQAPANESAMCRLPQPDRGTLREPHWVLWLLGHRANTAEVQVQLQEPLAAASIRPLAQSNQAELPVLFAKRNRG